jgi:FAD/FMN-containing dehydrogenase
MYGSKGFVQYQFVLPIDSSRSGLIEILEKIRAQGWGSFLAVLKLFGDQQGIMSFPMSGYTLALDFPIQRGLFKFLNQLDEIVLKYNGRLYLSKDARMDPQVFKASYQNYPEFVNIIKKYDPQRNFESHQSQRLKI